MDGTGNPPIYTPELPPTDILVVDALLWHGDSHPVHFTLKQGIELRNQIQPKQTFLVGMNCDSFLPHDEMIAYLQSTYGNVQLAHDGLVVDLSSCL